jgi:hypothetical protein
MTKEREALKLTLGALKDHVGNYKLDASGCTQQAAAIAAGEEALAQPEQEPLAWVTQVGTLVQVGMTNLKTGLMYGWTPLYTAPPKRELKSTTDMMMELADRLGELPDDVDPRAWEHLLVYAPKQKPVMEYDKEELRGTFWDTTQAEGEES